MQELPSLSEAQQDAISREVEKRLIEASLFEFLKWAFPIMEGGTKLDENWHLEYICHVIQKEIERIAAGQPKDKDLIICIPPRSLKSSIMMAVTGWTWIRFPHVKFNSSSYSQDLSYEHNRKSRGLIESDEYQAYFGDRFRILSDANKISKFDNDSAGHRMASSVGGTLTGKGANVFMIDDPIKPMDAKSEVAREEVKRWWRETASTRLDNQTTDVFIVIMQRVHEDDLVGYLTREEEGRWKVINIPAEAGPALSPAYLRKFYNEDSLFFPTRFSRKVLSDLRTRIGSFAYAAQYDQLTAPEEGNKIKVRWFGYYEPDSLPANLPVEFYIDTAYTKNENNDPSVILAFSAHGGFLYLRSLTEVWMEYAEFKRHLLNFVKQNGYTEQSRIFIEEATVGPSLLSDMRNVLVGTKPSVDEEGVVTYREIHLNVIGERVAGSKVQRVYEQLPRIEAGFVMLPKGAPWVDGFLLQCAQFPNGIHDDQVDCLTGAMRKGMASNWWDYL